MPMKLPVIILMIFMSSAIPYISLAQMIPESVNSTTRETSIIIESELNTDLIKENVLKTPTNEELSFILYRDRVTNTLRDNLYQKKTKEEFSFNPVSSLNGNLKFGGFWDGGVDLYFAPEVYIQPFDGVSIYAVRHSHVYIPLEQMQDNIKPLVIETICLAAIENAVNFLTFEDKVLNGILNFALKNGFTYLTQSARKEEQLLPTWEYYYCSIGITF
jgi:hypothetical protein